MLWKILARRLWRYLQREIQVSGVCGGREGGKSRLVVCARKGREGGREIQVCGVRTWRKGGVAYTIEGERACIYLAGSINESHYYCGVFSLQVCIIRGSY